METTQRRKITRNREFRSCTECRRRKLKCDRRKPCSACSRRDDSQSCLYERHDASLRGNRERRLQAESRLEHLESIVRQLSQAKEENRCLPSLCGKESMSVEAAGEQRPTSTSHTETDRILYAGPTHWSAMLDDIQELRYTIDEFDHDDPEQSTELSAEEDAASNSHADGILFGGSPALPLSSIVTQFLPSRAETDRLVSRYFRSQAVAAPFIHRQQFTRLYEQFWCDHGSQSPLWISILFSVMEITTRCLSGTGEQSKSQIYAFAAAHCLVAGGYSMPRRFAVEALLLYVQAKCLSSADAIPPDAIVILGIAVRLATRMGYHKDPACCRASFSPFEGEMRRRTWSLCLQLDMIVSFHFGLPSNIQYPTWNTNSPANLLDSDFDEDSAELPPPRPSSEPTTQLFYIAKHKIMAVFEKVIRHTLSTDVMPYIDIQAVDSDLRSTYSDIPDIYQPRATGLSVVDSPSLIVTRLCVRFLYLNSLCVLHQKRALHGHAQSVSICHDAATDLVGQVIELWPEFQPGGQLETERWFMGSLTWQHFLVGCSALCIIATSVGRSVAAPEVEESIAGISMDKTLNLLCRARNLCCNAPGTSKDTRMAVRVMDSVLSKYEHAAIQKTSAEPFSSASENIFTTKVGDISDWDLDSYGVSGPESPTSSYLEDILQMLGENLA